MAARLADMDASPADNGTVELIVCRPDFGERRVLDEGTFDEARGLIGDNWLARGSRHSEDNSALKGAQVAIMNSRVIAAIEPDRDRWPLAGDQLFLDIDLGAENLPAGQRLQIGDAVLEVSKIPHTGCSKFSQRFGKEATRFVNSREGRQARRRGINATIVQSGVVRVGDHVRKIDSSGSTNNLS
jgi:hypothetical protein